MSERMIRAGDIEIWTEAFGDAGDATILLIMGPGPGLLWPDGLCEGLADGGRHVIRYDHRNIGLSATVDFATHPSTISDIAADAVGVLDAYWAPTAHVVGFSGGGAIAQTMALEYPDQVLSLTSWGSSTLGTASFQTGRTLPGFRPRVAEVLARMFEPAADDQERIDRFVELRRAFSGTLAPLDEQEAPAMAKAMLAHTRDAEAVMSHLQAVASAPDRTDALAMVAAPTLVIHGTADPAVPLPHGEAAARAIPGARLLTIEGMGHDFPRPALTQIVAAILEHTAGRQR